MRKQFEIGMLPENDTYYYAADDEYHIYFKDTTVVGDDRYIALRAKDTKEFNVFMFLKDKKNITLDFCGATLVFHGKIQPFVIDSCENVTIKNCNVMYARPPYTEALITEAGENYARLKLNEHCTCRFEDGKFVPYGEGWENNRLNYGGCFYQVFDTETRLGCGSILGAMGTNHINDRGDHYHVTVFVLEQDEEDFILKGDIPEFFKPGRVLVIAHEKRSLSSMFLIDSKNVSVINYRILAGYGMGIYSYRTENITIDGLNLTYDEKSPCLIANSADVVHTFGTSGKFEIRNSVFEGMIDDAINIHSNFRTVNHVEGNEIYTDLASCEMQANELYRVGDVIAVYKGKTMEEAARYTITAISDAGEKVKQFTVDRPAQNHVEGDLIENLTANCEITVENCSFGKANTHIRFQSRGKVEFKNCVTELPVLLSGDASFWFESGPVTDLTVENCRFMGKRGQVYISSEMLPTEVEPYYHKNLKILNNEFEIDTPVQGGYVDGIVFKGNKNSLGKPMKLVLTNCGKVDAESCEVERITEVKTELKPN